MNEKRVPSDRWNGASLTREFLKNQIQTVRRQTLAPRKLLLLAVAAVFSLGAAVYFAVLAAPAGKKNLEWPLYGQNLANTRFQNVDEISPSNAAKLRVAWVFHTGVLDPNAELETSPIEAGGRLFITDGHDDVFALDATTGNQKWAYKPTQIPGEMPPLNNVFVCCGLNNRGVVFVPGSSREDDGSDDEQRSAKESKDKPDMVV